MTREARRTWSVGFFVELCLFILILVALYKVVTFLFSAGYFPPPFFHDTDDTFMDWYNTAYWAHHVGTYDFWRSVYPPLSFDFLRLFGVASCYQEDAVFARECDFAGVWTLLAFFALNFPIVYLTYRHNRDRASAGFRTLALCAGLPMLFALERGNLIIPCFTFFALGYGKVLRSARLRWIAVAFTVNFKPYLVLTILPQLFRRRWRWVEGCLVAVVIVYLISYVTFGSGTPWEIASNIINFAKPTALFSFNNSEYASSYAALIALMKSGFPLTFFIGSRPIELMSWLFPLLIHVGEAGVLLCFAATLLAPRAIPVARLSALGTAVAISATNPGGYTEVFLLFFVFQERWRGPALIVAIVSAYLLCIPWDHALARISYVVANSYLLQRTVSSNISVSLGEVLRPGLVLLIEYALIVASLVDVAQAIQIRRRPSWSGSPGFQAVG